MKNRYEVRGDVTAIFISSQHGDVEALISTDDLGIVAAFPNTWKLLKKRRESAGHYVVGNARNKSGRITTYLHRLIINASTGKVVDHINHNTLDNTRANLRLATKSENGFNRQGAASHNATGIRGVTKHRNKWRVTLAVGGKRSSFGFYDNIAEAEKVAIAVRAKYEPFPAELQHSEAD